MTVSEKDELRRLLNIYCDETEDDIENATEAGDDTNELEDLMTSIDDVRTSLSR